MLGGSSSVHSKVVVSLQTGQQTVAGLLCIACKKNPFLKMAGRLVDMLKSRTERPQNFEKHSVSSKGQFNSPQEALNSTNCDHSPFQYSTYVFDR
jgi:hypothetical protein